MYLFHSAGAVAIARSYTQTAGTREIDPTVRQVGSFDDPDLEGKSQNSRSWNTSVLPLVRSLHSTASNNKKVTKELQRQGAKCSV